MLQKPRPATVLAGLALAVAAAQPSYAAVQHLGRNSVGTKQLRNNAVTSPKIKNRTVTPSDLRPDARPGPSHSYAVYKDDAPAVSSGTARLATLHLPPGSYVVDAKATGSAITSSTTTIAFQCLLRSGNDLDEAEAMAPPDGYGVTVPLQLVNTGQSARNATLDCSSPGAVEFRWAKITAMKVRHLDNAPSA